MAVISKFIYIYNFYSSGSLTCVCCNSGPAAHLGIWFHKSCNRSLSQVGWSLPGYCWSYKSHSHLSLIILINKYYKCETAFYFTALKFYFLSSLMLARHCCKSGRVLLSDSKTLPLLRLRPVECRRLRSAGEAQGLTDWNGQWINRLFFFGLYCLVYWQLSGFCTG